MQDRESDRLVPVPEARQILGGVSARWLWSNTAPRGPIPCVRLSRRCMYVVSDLLRYAASQRQTLRASIVSDLKAKTGMATADELPTGDVGKEVANDG
jgi:hypothetical protein